MFLCSAGFLAAAVLGLSSAQGPYWRTTYSLPAGEYWLTNGEMSPLADGAVVVKDVRPAPYTGRAVAVNPDGSVRWARQFSYLATGLFGASEYIAAANGGAHLLLARDAALAVLDGATGAVLGVSDNVRTDTGLMGMSARGVAEAPGGAWLISWVGHVWRMAIDYTTGAMRLLWSTKVNSGGYRGFAAAKGPDADVLYVLWNNPVTRPPRIGLDKINGTDGALVWSKNFLNGTEVALVGELEGLGVVGGHMVEALTDGGVVVYSTLTLVNATGAESAHLFCACLNADGSPRWAWRNREDGAWAKGIEQEAASGRLFLAFGRLESEALTALVELDPADGRVLAMVALDGWIYGGSFAIATVGNSLVIPHVVGYWSRTQEFGLSRVPIPGSAGNATDVPTCVNDTRVASVAAVFEPVPLDLGEVVDMNRTQADYPAGLGDNGTHLIPAVPVAVTRGRGTCPPPPPFTPSFTTSTPSDNSATGRVWVATVAATAAVAALGL